MTTKPATKTARPRLDAFTFAYVACALWSEKDDNGAPLDARFSVDDIAPEALGLMIRDCARFQRENASDIDSGADRFDDHTARAGHDFWLTRVGHGAGFWDGDWPEPEATRLTSACKAFGSMDLYAWRGRIYCTPTPRPHSGYAFQSSRRHPREPETVMLGADEMATVCYVGTERIDGAECAAFKVRGQNRYFFQLAVCCR